MKRLWPENRLLETSPSPVFEGLIQRSCRLGHLIVYSWKVFWRGFLKRGLRAAQRVWMVHIRAFVKGKVPPVAHIARYQAIHKMARIFNILSKLQTKLLHDDYHSPIGCTKRKSAETEALNSTRKGLKNRPVLFLGNALTIWNNVSVLHDPLGIHDCHMYTVEIRTLSVLQNNMAYCEIVDDYLIL